MRWASESRVDLIRNLNFHPRRRHGQAFEVIRVSLDEAEQGQSTVSRMVGEAEGVAVVNRR